MNCRNPRRESRDTITTKASRSSLAGLREVAIEFLTYTARKLSTDSKADSASLEICSALPTDGISPGAVAAVGVGFGAGDGEPSVGICPARTEDERAHVRATAIRNRFMGSPLEF